MVDYYSHCLAALRDFFMLVLRKPLYGCSCEPIGFLLVCRARANQHSSMLANPIHRNRATKIYLRILLISHFFQQLHQRLQFDIIHFLLKRLP